MNLKDTQCCAIQEIGGLSNHHSGEKAMVEFCRLSLSSNVRYFTVEGKRETLYSFYLFTAALDTDHRYGHDFATFIKDNKLGEVWASRAIRNKAFHPDHDNQVWIWTPNRDAVVAWWKAKSAGKVVPPPDPMYCQDCGAELGGDGLCDCENVDYPDNEEYDDDDD